MSSPSVPGPIVRITSPNNPDDGHCLINLVIQKGWSLQVPLCITYSRRADTPNSPLEVLAKVFPSRWPHPLSSAEKLPSYQVLNMQAEFIKTGRCDKNLLYDTAELISFPSIKLDGVSYAGIQLYDNREETINMRITIPEHFPNDLLNKPIFIEVNCKIESLSSEASITLGIIVIDDTSTGNAYVNVNNRKLE